MTSTQPYPTEPTGPLHGLLVLDLTRALAGPHAAMMLGDLGADVIKVENPQGGDDTRGWGPPFVEPEHGALREPKQEVRHTRPQGRGGQGCAAGADRQGRRADGELSSRCP